MHDLRQGNDPSSSKYLKVFKALGVGVLVAIVVVKSFFIISRINADPKNNLDMRESVNGNIVCENSGEQNFPAGTLNGETVAVFSDENSYRSFLEYAAKNGIKIISSSNALKAVRVFGELRMPDDLSNGISSLDFNYKMRIPTQNEIFNEKAEARKNTSTGLVPVGGGAMALLGVTGENIARSTRGDGVVIAVVDTGIFAEHSSLAGVDIRVIDIAGGVPDSAESVAHGTAVASLISGTSENISGLSPDASILSVRVFDGAGAGDTWTLAQGIVAAVDAGANVLNISAGVSVDASILRNAVDYALQHGVTIIASAGNEGVTSLSYPAAYQGVIAVGAVDGAGTSAPFSNVGENLSVCAPGVAVTAAGTADVSAETAFSGTSASAPLITGLVASAIAGTGIAQSPEHTAEVLANTSDDRGEPGNDQEYGYGIADFERITRPVGVPVKDLRISDIYMQNAGGGKTTGSVIVGVQNRGNVWSSTAVLQITLSLSNGTVKISSAGIGTLPANGTAGTTIELPKNEAETFKIGVDLIGENGEVLDSVSAVK